MLVSYYYIGDISQLSDDELTALQDTLDKSDFRADWYLDGSALKISGECSVDEYSTSAQDVGDEIEWLLKNDAHYVEVYGRAEEVNCDFYFPW